MEKLRQKLGLSRPVADYQAMDRTNTKHAYLDFIAREDGTVWIGSFPNTIGNIFTEYSSTITKDLDNGTRLIGDVVQKFHNRTCSLIKYNDYNHTQELIPWGTKLSTFSYISDSTLSVEKGTIININGALGEVVLNEQHDNLYLLKFIRNNGAVDYDVFTYDAIIKEQEQQTTDELPTPGETPDRATSALHHTEAKNNTVLGMGYLSYGHRLPKYLGITREKVFYHIPDFATLQTKKGHYIASNTIQACNQEWVMLVYPRGDDEGDGKITHITSTAVDDDDDGDGDYVSVHLLYIGHNPETDPVRVKIAIYTTTDDKKTDKEEQIKKCFTFSTKQISQCLSPNLVHHKNILQYACNSVTGTLTITMEIEEEDDDDDDEEHQKISATILRPSPPYFSPSFIANRCRCGKNDPRLCRCGRE